jgi:hypothetical protein
MFTVREIDDADPALRWSPWVRGVERTFAWIEEHGGIPLTPSKAFKRTFVHWAAAEFDWPGHTAADLYVVNKVLNEQDFMPLVYLHEVLLAMKLGRHYKGQFRLTKAGQALVGHPGRIFNTVVPFFLFRVDHAASSRFNDEPVLGNWDIFLNVLNIETEDGATGADLRRVFYGEPEAGFDAMMSGLYVQVLRPLCWAGLLEKQDGASRYRSEDALFVKTPLWRSALVLDTDAEVAPATRH